MSISETTLLLRLPRHFKKQIEAEAKKKFLSLSALIRLAISEWLSEQRQRKNFREKSR